MGTIKRQRETNIELCRIVSMVLIIMHHCATHGGGTNIDGSINKWIAYSFVPLGKICFNTFIAISMWFLVDSEFKFKKFFLLLYRKVLLPENS